jgi:2'-hydroxyisoflavone reductase
MVRAAASRVECALLQQAVESSMKLLVIGGTVFLGRHIVECALQCGHEVTLFNRGISNVALFRELERITGDRANVSNLIEGRRFDAVIDVCGYFPEEVSASARALDDADVYAIISTISVYGNLANADDESAPLCNPLWGRELSGSTLGPLKAACEQQVYEVFRDRALIIRAGLLAGPYDIASRGRETGSLDYDAFSPRFPYWPLRFADHGPVLAPGNRSARLQVLDARDLASWTVALVEKKKGGHFNATGAIWSMEELVHACAQVQNSTNEVIWVEDEFLQLQGIKMLTEIPFWIPSGAPVESLMRVPSDKARQHGLVPRPLKDTVYAVLEWGAAHPLVAVAPRSPVLSRQRESELLALWHQFSSKGSRKNLAGSPA